MGPHNGWDHVLTLGLLGFIGLSSSAGAAAAAVPIGQYRQPGLTEASSAMRLAEMPNFAEENSGDVGGAHEHAGVAGLGLFDSIHRERADGVGHTIRT